MKTRTGRHSASGYALRSVAAEERGKKSTLSREVFSLDNPDHLIYSVCCYEYISYQASDDGVQVDSL